MELKDIRQLIKFLQGSDISEIEIHKEGASVKISRNLGGQEGTPVVQMAPPVVATAPAPAAPPPEPTAPAEKDASEPEGNAIAITSPMVGTFYRSPAPEAPFFVNEGDTVKKGQVICIIEAMKLMNEIEAETSGTLVR
ncbi:acetyl-CoA carboxylase biotin carboxyl carrier protein, partial [Magnetococcales bacterium HHB-1]